VGYEINADFMPIIRHKLELPPAQRPDAEGYLLEFTAPDR
jgi:hypothetical protein